MDRITDTIATHDDSPIPPGIGHQIKQIEASIRLARTNPALKNHSTNMTHRLLASAAQIHLNGLLAQRNNLLAQLPRSARKGITRGKAAIV